MVESIIEDWFMKVWVSFLGYVWLYGQGLARILSPEVLGHIMSTTSLRYHTTTFLSPQPWFCSGEMPLLQMDSSQATMDRCQSCELSWRTSSPVRLILYVQA